MQCIMINELHVDAGYIPDCFSELSCEQIVVDEVRDDLLLASECPKANKWIRWFNS